MAASIDERGRSITVRSPTRTRARISARRSRAESKVSRELSTSIERNSTSIRSAFAAPTSRASRR
jgi:hypothetical protein